MNGKGYLLDTNIVIALFANEDSVVKSLSQAEMVYIPGIVIGELFYDAFKSVRVDDNLQRIQ
jgi:tRNA(fMet)-specific endonuclease VapC